MTSGIYIHIPFCVSKCDYCDFLSFAPEGFSEAVYKPYTDALLREMRVARSNPLCDAVDTVYIGGGTPTALPAPLLIQIIREARRFTLTADAEFTVEANPGTLTPEILSVLGENGVNRLSVGMQAWQDRLLKIIGRTHTQAIFERNIRAARTAGFSNINVDLIFALPGQTARDWQESLKAAVSFSPEHISLYSLTPEDGTPLWRRVQNKELILPGDDADRDMYETGIQFLTRHGYRHYELSNFAKPGYESRHNTRYWKRSPYYGFGLGAHSFDGKTRRSNIKDLNRYIQGIHPADRLEAEEQLTARDAMSETMFLGLRLLEGVSAEVFYKTHGVTLAQAYGSVIDTLCGDGLLYFDGVCCRLTRRGMDLANRVFMEFI